VRQASETAGLRVTYRLAKCLLLNQVVMMPACCFALAFTLYLALDLSNPFMPGAFVFDPSESVEISLGDPRPLKPEATAAAKEARPWSHTRATIPSGPRRAMPLEVRVLAEWIADLRQAHPQTSQPSLEDH
jgi:hypothetical protein